MDCVAHQSPLSLGFSRQEYCSGLPCPPTGALHRDQIANICWIMEKAREFQKNIYLCFIDYAKAFDCTINCGKFFKRWEYKTT